MFLDETQIRKAISNIFSGSKKIDCAVAFVGEKAIDFIESNCKVRLICNLESGATNPNAIKELIKNNVEVKTLSSLHAKVYIGDSYAVIGSANLTANGLGLEGDEIFGLIEAGFQVEDTIEKRNIVKWWKELWELSIKVEEDDLEQYIEKWSKRRKIRPTHTIEKSLLKILVDTPEKIKDRRIFIVIYTENQMSDEAQQTLTDTKNKKKYGINVEAYEGWDQLPEDAHLLDFYVGPQGGVYYQGIYKTPDKKILIKFSNSDGEEETLFLCYQEKNVIGCSLTPNDIKKIKPIILKMLNSKNFGIGNQNGKYIDVMDARDFIKS